MSLQTLCYGRETPTQWKSENCDQLTWVGPQEMLTHLKTSQESQMLPPIGLGLPPFGLPPIGLPPIGLTPNWAKLGVFQMGVDPLFWV